MTRERGVEHGAPFFAVRRRFPFQNRRNFPFGVFENRRTARVETNEKSRSNCRGVFRTRECVTRQPASRSREKREPRKFETRRETPERAPFVFLCKKTIGPAASIEPSCHPFRVAPATQNPTRVVSVPQTAPGDASPSPPLCPGTSPNDTQPREPHRARAERASTRTHDASAGGARQRRRQSETSVSRGALARFSRA